MKAYLFAGVAAAILATSIPGHAAPAAKPAPAAAAAPKPVHEVTFADVKAAADALWARFDVNKDGRIDSADRDAELLKHFDMWDTNHDGSISKDEFLAHIHEREGRGPHPGGPDGPPPPMDGPDHRGPGHWGRGGPGMGPHPGGFAAMAIVGPALHEARKDGVVTRAAFDAAVKARFDRFDANHDGKLSHEELHAAFRDGPGHGRWGRERWGHDRDHHHHWHWHGDDRGRGHDGPPDGDGPPPPPAGAH
jgi:hypothetical protein